MVFVTYNKKFVLFLLSLLLPFTPIFSEEFRGNNGYVEYKIDVLGFGGSWIYKQFLDQGLKVTLDFSGKYTDNFYSLNFCNDVPTHVPKVRARINCSNGYSNFYTGEVGDFVFDVVLRETDVTCNFKIEVNTTYEAEENGRCFEKTVYDSVEGSISLLSGVAVLNKEPAKNWDIKAKWEESCDEYGNCVITAYIDRNQEAFFELTEGNGLDFVIEVNLDIEEIKGFTLDPSGVLKYGDFEIEKVDPSSIKATCTFRDVYGSMDMCPIRVEKKEGFGYEILLGPCRPDWYITVANEDDYFEGSCDISLDVVAYDHNKKLIARQTYKTSLERVKFNVTGIIGAKSLNELLDEALTNMTSSLRQASIFYWSVYAYQSTASALLIGFGKLAAKSLECPSLNIEQIRNNQQTVNSALENILFFSKVTWCQLANTAFNTIKTYFLMDLLKKLDDNKVQVTINDKTVEYNKLSAWIKENIKKMLFLVGSQASLCTWGSIKLLDANTDDINKPIEELFRVVCAPYYLQIKDYLEFKKMCEEGKVEEIWSSQCKEVFNELNKDNTVENWLFALKENYDKNKEELGSCAKIFERELVTKDDGKFKFNVEKLCEKEEVIHNIDSIKTCVSNLERNLIEKRIALKSSNNPYLISESFWNCLERNSYSERALFSCIIETDNQKKNQIISELTKESLTVPNTLICEPDTNNKKIKCSASDVQVIKVRDVRAYRDGIKVYIDPIEIRIVAKELQKANLRKLLSCEEISSLISLPGVVKINKIPFLDLFGEEFEISASCVNNEPKVYIYDEDVYCSLDLSKEDINITKDTLIIPVKGNLNCHYLIQELEERLNRLGEVTLRYLSSANQVFITLFSESDISLVLELEKGNEILRLNYSSRNGKLKVINDYLSEPKNSDYFYFYAIKIEDPELKNLLEEGYSIKSHSLSIKKWYSSTAYTFDNLKFSLEGNSVIVGINLNDAMQSITGNKEETYEGKQVEWALQLISAVNELYKKGVWDEEMINKYKQELDKVPDSVLKKELKELLKLAADLIPKLEKLRKKLENVEYFELDLSLEIKTLLKDKTLTEDLIILPQQLEKLDDTTKEKIKKCVLDALYDEGFLGMGKGEIDCKILKPYLVGEIKERLNCESLKNNQKITLSFEEVNIKTTIEIGAIQENEKFCSLFNSLRELKGSGFINFKERFKALEGFTEEKKKELCSLAEEPIEQKAYLLSVIWKVAMEDVGKRIELLGHAVKSMNDCYAGDYWFSMFFFWAGPHLAKTFNAYCGFSAIQATAQVFNENSDSLLAKFGSALAGPVGAMCAWMNINSYCTAQTYDILAITDWGSLLPGVSFIPFIKSGEISTPKITAVIALKPERPTYYAEADWSKRGEIFGLPYKVDIAGSGFLSGLMNYFAQSLETTMVPCAKAVGDRINDLVNLIQKNRDCIKAYIAPNYFEGLRAKAAVERIEEELETLKPVLEELNDETINNKISELKGKLDNLRNLAEEAALADLGLIKLDIEIEPTEDAKEKFNLYYRLYLSLKESKEELERLKENIEGNNEMKEDLRSRMLNEINSALDLINQIMNSIPSSLRSYFENREVALQQPFDRIDLIAEIINNPDKFQGVKECLNFSYSLACTQKLKRSMCYFAAFGGAIDSFIAKVRTERGEDFTREWLKRLGNPAAYSQTGYFEQAINALKPIFEICEMNIQSIKTMYNFMKQKEEIISRSIAEELARAKDCQPGQEIVYSLRDKGIIVEDCKLINEELSVWTKENLDVKVCTIDKTVGLSISGKEVVTQRTNQVDRDKVRVTGGKDIRGSTVIIGKTTSNYPLSTSLSLESSVLVENIKECQKQNTEETKKCIIEKIQEAVIRQYSESLSYSFVYLEEQRLRDTIDYNIVGSLICKARPCSSDLIQHLRQNIIIRCNLDLIIDNLNTQTPQTNNNENKIEIKCNENQLINENEIKEKCGNNFVEKIKNNLKNYCGKSIDIMEEERRCGII